MGLSKGAIYLLAVCLSFACSAQFRDYSDHYINNENVKLHYVTKGEGPIILFLHGFPDFWFTWKYQMDHLATTYKVVGMDLRAYNYSEGPNEVDAYKMRSLMSDVLTVIKDLGDERVILVANDWGGAIAWQLATYFPDKVSHLVACNIPHPRSLRIYLFAHPETADYTKKNQTDNATEYWTLDRLMDSSDAYKSNLSQIYREAFKRSNLQGMLHYYTASYPKPSTLPLSTPNPPALKKIQCPVLMIHGLKDEAFPAGTLNDHWLWMDNSFALHTLPDAGHFVQREAPERVLTLISRWLDDQS